MDAQTAFRTALRSLSRAPLHSGLTSLGIVIGVAAVIATAGIGSGARVRIQQALQRPETRTINLNILDKYGSQVQRQSMPTLERLSPADYYAIRARLSHGSAATPRVYASSVHISAAGRSSKALLEGLDVQGFEIFTRQLLEGVLFNHLDVEGAANVAVVSQSLRDALFRNRNAIDQTLVVGRTAFVVVGVVNDIQNVRLDALRGPDLHIYVPYTSLLKRVDRNAQMTISVQAPTVESVHMTQVIVNDVMEQERRGRRGMFLTTNALDSIRSYADGSSAVAHLLAAVGAVALIVGGVGIMNIMLVSITQRAREIGIRVALGTRRSAILAQFLIEAIVLASLGGFAGAILGVLVAEILARANSWPTQLTWTSIFGSLFCSAMVGAIFGCQPARRAAALEPIHSLRME